MLENITAKATRIFSRSSILLQKHSPEILVVGGVIGIVASTVMACKATTKLEDAVELANARIEDTKQKFSEYNEDSGEYEIIFAKEDIYRRELTVTYFKNGIDFVKLYAPAVMLGVASISAILYGHNILRKRNIAMAAAYKALDEGFEKYRERVKKELGEEAEARIKRGGKVEEIEIEEKDKDGKTKKKKVKVESINPEDVSQYAKFFDQASVHWTKNADTNLFTLTQIQKFANQKLQSRGHVFLNEIYDMLDIPRTQAGAVVGWVIGNGDDYVDFGIYDKKKDANRRFVNGDEAVILLDFNVDGPIWDLI